MNERRRVARIGLARANFLGREDVEEQRQVGRVGVRADAEVLGRTHREAQLRVTGTAELRALLVFDEIYGYVPPHPANPPAKRAIVSLMKQARAFGVGVVLATQNPMDLDYRALSNAGLWFVGRLQTDADRERVVEAMAGRDGRELTEVVRVLAPRWFVLRSPRHPEQPLLLQSRTTLSWLKGPLTRGDLRKLRGEGSEG